jgi:hypothetical protein
MIERSNVVASASAAASDMPGGIAYLISNWPSSTLGKKSVGVRARSTAASATAAAATTYAATGRRNVQRRSATYAPSSRRVAGAACVRAPSAAASDGATKSESTIETTSAIASVIASARKKNPGTPPRNASGKNTTRFAAVEATSGFAIRRTAAEIATRRVVPPCPSSARAIASTTTIVSSTTSPIAIASPPSVIRSSRRPARTSTSTVRASATGNTIAAVNVSARSRRKRAIARSAISAPAPISKRNARCEARIKRV